MNEQDTFNELAIGNLLKREVDLHKEWINSGETGVDIDRMIVIQKEHFEVVTQITEFYINQQRNF